MLNGMPLKLTGQHPDKAITKTTAVITLRLLFEGY